MFKIIVNVPSPYGKDFLTSYFSKKTPIVSEPVGEKIGNAALHGFGFAKIPAFYSPGSTNAVSE